MAIPKIILKKANTELEKFYDIRVPKDIRKKIKFLWENNGNEITLYENRPSFQNPKEWIKIPIARLEYDQEVKQWKLYCHRSPTKLDEEYWERYLSCKASHNILDLIKSIDKDEHHIFWG